MTTKPRELKPIPVGVTKHDMRRHVRQLCAEHNISIRLRDNYTRGTASATLRMIWIPEVRSPITYAKALHEIGHVVMRHTNDKDRNVLTREGEAWQWARDNALIWTDTMEDRACRWATTYVRGMQRRINRGDKQWKKRPVGYPPADDPIWRFSNIVPDEANV